MDHTLANLERLANVVERRIVDHSLELTRFFMLASARCAFGTTQRLPILSEPT
jgi:hypothetical protein